MADEELDKEYVNLAIGILGEDIKTEKCTAARKDKAVPEFLILSAAQDAVDDSGGDQTDAESQALADAQDKFDAALSDEQVEKLVGASGSRALRSYALGLLTGATPFGVELDKQQKVALLCGDVSVVDVTSSANESEDAAPADKLDSGTGATLEDLSAIEAQMFALFREQAEVTSIPGDCRGVVVQSIGQITESGAQVEALLPAGQYQVDNQLSPGASFDDPAPTTTKDLDAVPVPTYLQLVNDNWVLIRADDATLDGDCPDQS